MKSTHGIFVFQVVAHCALAYTLFFGTLQMLLVMVIMYCIGACVGGTVTYHRLLAHKAFDAPTWFKYVGPIIGLLNGSGSPIGWTAIHRKHHRFTDTEKDPHSPYFKPFWRVQFFSMMELPEIKYVPDLLRSKFHVFLHQKYWWILAVWWLVLFAISWKALVAVLAANALVWEASAFINTACHKWGYRNHETRDHSVNNPICGYLVFGEGWHNNHHAFPASASFSSKWYELDLGHRFIQAITLNKK